MGKKKGRRSQPVPRPRDDGRKIVIPKDELPKTRGVPVKRGGPMHNRRHSVQRGSRRRGKHPRRFDD